MTSLMELEFILFRLETANMEIFIMELWIRQLLQMLSILLLGQSLVIFSRPYRRQMIYFHHRTGIHVLFLNLEFLLVLRLLLLLEEGAQINQTAQHPKEITPPLLQNHNKCNNPAL